MELYYIKEIKEGVNQLEGEQFRHIVKAMRKKPGDMIEMTDGRGARAVAEITMIGKRFAEIRIRDVISVPKAPYSIDVAVALTKNSKRIEWAVEKMTELGISSVTPILCARSERDRMNAHRMENILVAAIKQSRQYYLPHLSRPMAFDAFCGERLKNYDGARLIAHLTEESRPLRHNYQAGQDVVILIGPEGDFTDDEVRLARQSGCTEIRLGSTRLRTETAAIAAVAYIHALND